VLTSNRELMAQARSSLKDKWGITIVGTLIYFSLSYGINRLPYIHYILSSVLEVGYAAFMLVIIRKQDIKLELLFSGLSRFFTALLAGLTLFLLILLLILPPMLGYFMLTTAKISIYILIVLIIIECVVTVFAALFVVKVYYCYSLVYYLISDLPKIFAFQALTLSRKMMHGNQLKRFYLDCRFIGWYLLGIAPFILTIALSVIHQHGFSASYSDWITYWNMSQENPWSSNFGLLCTLALIGFIWIFPYWQATLSHFYEDVKHIEHTEKHLLEHTEPFDVNDAPDFVME